MKRTVQQGFTLIELMIVVAIIGILAAVALPAYTDYMIKGRMSEVVLATSQCRTTITETYQTAPAGTTMTVDGWGCGEGNPAAGLTKFVKSISTDVNGKISVLTQTTTDLGTASAKTLTLTPKDSAGVTLTTASIPTQVFTFKCGDAADTVPTKYRPGSCK